MDKTSSKLSPVFSHAMERIEQFAPEVVDAVPRHTAQAYAVAYAQYYEGNVPQLEREREFLLAALALAWGQERHTQVIQLMKGLASIAGRLGNNDEGARILTWGIQACRRTHDRYHLASFLSCLSGLLWSQGKYGEARQTWAESMAMASAIGRPACLWEPLYNVVHIADLLDNYSTVQRFTDTLLQAQDSDNSDSVVVARFLRGFFARFNGELDRAYDDFNTCLHPLTTENPVAPSAGSRQFFTFEVQTELARVQGDCSHAHQHTSTTVSFAQHYCDPYTVAILLIDQMLFANYMGQLHETRPLLQRLLQLIQHIGAPHLRNAANFLRQKLQETAPELTLLSPSIALEKPSKEQRHRHTLSTREVEILQLVASGLSNRDIANQLVLSIATVKKHLEHINDRLDTHSRTQALAVARAAGML